MVFGIDGYDSDTAFSDSYRTKNGMVVVEVAQRLERDLAAAQENFAKASRVAAEMAAAYAEKVPEVAALKDENATLRQNEATMTTDLVALQKENERLHDAWKKSREAQLSMIGENERLRELLREWLALGKRIRAALKASIDAMIAKGGGAMIDTPRTDAAYERYMRKLDLPFTDMVELERDLAAAQEQIAALKAERDKAKQQRNQHDCKRKESDAENRTLKAENERLRGLLREALLWAEDEQGCDVVTSDRIRAALGYTVNEHQDGSR